VPLLQTLTRRIGPALVPVLALLSFGLIVVRAIRTVDPYWDTLQYHWPFAARVAGLCGRDCYSMPFGLEARYDGFPLLLHAVQGWLWRLTGTPGLADLINIAMLLALAGYLRYRFAVPLAWSWLAFLAIPEVQIQLTSSYIDVPVNAAATIALMVVLRMLVRADADHRPDVAIALAALGIAAGSKYQMVPIAFAAWAVIVLHGAWKPSAIGLRRHLAAFALLSVAGIVVLLPKLAMNAVTFGNPFYPIDMTFAGVHWPGPEGMASTNSISAAWIDSPGPVRWLASVLEIDAFRGRVLPWTIGQGDVPQSSPSFMMGGYFVAYVLGAVALLWWGARSNVAARRAATLVLVLSLLCAFLPASHELRYYLFWMLTLVCCTLALVHSPAFANPQQAAQRNITHALVAIAVVSVVSMTGAAYLRPGGETLAELLQGTDAVVARVPEGGTLCVLNRNRNALLYSSLFHPPRHYRTKLLFAEEKAGCTVRLHLEP
jgi:hypothetical protein